MTGEQIVVVLLAVLSTFEAIVVLLIRSRVIELGGKVDDLNSTIQNIKPTAKSTFPRAE